MEQRTKIKSQFGWKVGVRWIEPDGGQTRMVEKCGGGEMKQWVIYSTDGTGAGSMRIIAADY